MEDVAVVCIPVALPLLRQRPPPPREALHVARALPKRRHTPALARCDRPELREPPARVEFELGVLGEGDANGVTEAIEEEGADADGALHSAVLALARLCTPARQH